MTAEQSSASLLHRFRSDRKRLPLHPLEKAVLTVVALHLCFLPWALGTMHVWSQLTSLGFSILGFGLALIPRNYSSEFSGGPAMRLTMWPRLLHFPLFWIGLALLAYIAIQGVNPSWIWESNAHQWWLRRVNDIPWLPTSIDTPFERFNLWRQFIIYSATWLTMCTVWMGFTRRRSLQILLTVLALNGLALAIAGFIGRIYFPNWEWVLWLNNKLLGASAFASFIYKNHAGAYLSLLAGTAVSLAAWHHDHGLRNLARSTPGMLWLLTAVAMTFGVIYTYSRGATLLLVIYFGLAAVSYLCIRLFSSTRSTASPLVWLLVTGLLIGSIVIGAKQLNYAKVEHRFAALLEKPGIDRSVAQRLDTYKAGKSMLGDHWQRGIGAGGFRFLFPEYIKSYPESYMNGQFFWEHAHCDWLQLPIELGVCGAALIALAGLWGLTALFQLKLWRNSSMLLLFLASLQTPIQAVFDFPLQNPAVLLTWCVLLILTLRWAELEPVG